MEISEEELNEALKKELRLKTYQELEAGKINWIEGENWTWDYCKGYAKKMWGHKEEFIGEDIKWFFLAHANDVIKGKPQLIQNCKVRLPLVRHAIKKEAEEDWDSGKGKFIKTGNDIEIQSFYFFDENFDKRHDGFQRDAFALDFYKYQVITHDDKEIYVFSNTKLPSETCIIKGMEIEMSDYSEMSRTMKIPSIARIFFVKEAEPAVKTMEKKELIKIIQEKKIKINDFLNHLAYHPFGTFNNFPIESELLNASQLLCGKFDGYPLHIVYMGVQGSRKTMGKGETIEFKFGDEKIMIDSGNSRLKGLGASYKGVVANHGYLAKSDRIAIVDEVGKMVEAEINKIGGTNLLGNLNAILEHKERKVVSGNTSESCMKPTAKFIFLTNPVSYRKTISNHVGLIDATFMSRSLWWVQDDAEVDFVLKNGVMRTPQDFNKTIDEEILSQKTSTSIYVLMKERKNILLKKSFGVDIDRDLFLTIFDSCYSFVSEVEHSKVQEIVDTIIKQAKEPMTGIWKSRGFHHTFLLVDGLCKLRCLFEDYDATFTAKQQDYDLATSILNRMVRSWDTDLSPKEEFGR